MEANIRVFSMLPFNLLHIGIYASCVLAMRHDECRRRTEYLPKLLFLIDEHTSGTAAHKELHTRTLSWVEPFDFLQVVIRSTKIETIIHMTLPFSKGITLLQKLESSGLRHDIRHIKHSRHASSGSGSRLTLHRSLMRKTWLTHMNVLIDDARKQDKLLSPTFEGDRRGFLNLYYLSILNANGRLIALALIHDCYILYNEGADLHVCYSSANIFSKACIKTFAIICMPSSLGCKAVS